MNGHIVGYARVSAADQNLDRQLAALGDVDKLFSEKRSGKSTDRQQLREMLDYVRSGDTIRVKSPDRLARSTTDLLTIVKKMKDEGVAVEFVDNPSLNTNTPQGEFMLTVLAAVAQLERATSRERQAEGIVEAKKKGVYEKKAKLTAEQIAQAKQNIDMGVPKAVLARDLGVSRSTLYAALNGTGKYADGGAR
ncbi:MAG: recombinase family protein [Corynebacterium sp.]|uniref:recombinase family protein n=1 Tax=Corynebacterium sp. TaxID=1720 RepID=UPI003EFE791A